MKNFLKGFIIGIGKIIPGVSGAMLAIIMGIYDKSLYYLNNFKQNKKESLKYLLPIGLGVLLSIIIFSKIIDYVLKKYYLITMLFFIGLIIGGLPFVAKKVEKNSYLFVAITFLIFFIISISNISSNYIVKNNFIDQLVFLISGFVEAIGTVVPGISSTALLLIVGTYNIIISSIGNITNLSLIVTNLKVLIPFTIGLIIGIIIVVKIVNILFKKYEKKTYSFILGILLSSITLLIFQAFSKPFKLVELIIGVFLLIIGIFISNLMEE
ncbi:MAG: undecaprenyl phosphate translocase family protein [Bacilli bacterium]